MAGELIPDDLREFIQRYIDTVAQLEALLLLQAHPDEGWSVLEVKERLYTSEKETTEVLTRLCEDGLLRCEEGVFLYRGDDARRGMVDRLAGVYATHLVPVTNMIHAKPRRVREFADAFKLRKER